MKRYILIIAIFFLGVEASAVQQVITVGTPNSPASLSQNFTNAQKNFTELFSGKSCQVNNYAQLRLLTTLSSGDICIVASRTSIGDGGGGVFYWDNSDRISSVSADPQSGLYVAPDSDQTGANGAWVRQYSGAVNTLWFGGILGAGNGPQNTQAILAAMSLSDNVIIPDGYNEIVAPLIITRNRQSIQGESIESWLVKAGNFNLLSLTGDRNEVRNLTLFGDSNSNKLLHVGGGKYFAIDNVHISGAWSGAGAFTTDDTCLAYDNAVYGKLANMHIYNCRTGVSDLGGGSGATSFTNVSVYNNDTGVDFSGFSNFFTGGSIAHNKTTDAKVGTRRATSSFYTTHLRGFAIFTNVHWESDSGLATPMIEVGDSQSESIAADVSAVKINGGFLALNSTTRNFIAYHAGMGAGITDVSVNGANASNPGLIKTTTQYALNPSTQGILFPSGATIPAIAGD